MGLATKPKTAPEGKEVAQQSPYPTIRKIYIGIDPGTTTGLAVYENKQLTELLSGGHSEMILKVLEMSQMKNVVLLVILEDVHADETNFVASQFIRKMMDNPELKRNIPSETKRREYATNAACKRSRDSGMVAGLSADWKLFLKMKQIKFETIAPSQRQNLETFLKKVGNGTVKYLPGVIRDMKAPTKLNRQQFGDYTGWVGSSNEHTRDAGCLVWWYAKIQNRIAQN